MARNEKILLTESVLATEAMVDVRRLITAAGAIAGLGERVLGVLQAETSDAEWAPVATHGIILGEAGGAFAVDDKLMSDASGKLVKHELNEALNQLIKVAADQALTEEVTLQDATSLSFAMIASGVYLMKGKLKFTNADSGAARGIDIALDLPTAGAATGFIKTVDSAGTVTEVEVTDFTAVTVLADVIPLSGSVVVTFEAIITLSTTAGNAKVQWAQETSDTDAITLLNDSFVETVKDLADYKIAGMAIDAASADGDIVRMLR